MGLAQGLARTKYMGKQEIMSGLVNTPLRKRADAVYRDFFSKAKIENFIGKNLIFLIILLKSFIYVLEQK